MDTASWEHFEHKADIGIRGYGDTLAEAFEQIALAMTAVVADIDAVNATTALHIRCSEDSDDTLLFAWLNALIYEMATRKMLFSRFDVEINETELNASVAGEPIEIARHQPVVEIKGATYTELAVYRANGQWVAQCVVDV